MFPGDVLGMMDDSSRGMGGPEVSDFSPSKIFKPRSALMIPYSRVG